MGKTITNVKSRTSKKWESTQADVYSITKTSKGLRWALRVNGFGYLKKYSNILVSDAAWRQFIQEMGILGLPLFPHQDRVEAIYLVKRTFVGSTLRIRVGLRDGGRIHVVFDALMA